MDPKTVDLKTLGPEAIYDWVRTATPPEIDLLQSRLGAEWSRYWTQRERASDQMTRSRSAPPEVRQRYADERAKADGKCQWYDTLRAGCEHEYIKRGGWTRYYLVKGANGHVHWTTRCSTCNRNGQATDFAWLTQYSGMPMHEFVNLAGERACTVCFPDAPVEKRSMLDDDVAERERLEKVRQEREAKRQEKLAKAIKIEDGKPVELKLDSGERVKTRVSADRAAVAAYSSYRNYVDKAKKAQTPEFKEHMERMAVDQLNSFAQVVQAYADLGELYGEHHERLRAKGQAMYDKRGY